MIDSESKETDDKRNQHGSQGKSQSSRGTEVLQIHRAPQTGGERKGDGGDGDGEDEKRRKKELPGDKVDIDDQEQEKGEEDKEQEQEKDSAGKIINTTT